MTIKYKLLLFLTSLSLVGATFSAHAVEQPRGEDVLLPFKQQLQKALLSGMSKGVVEAIEVCSVEAPEIAKSFSQDGIYIGRTSDRLRNLDNASPDWVEPILNTYLANNADREPRNVSLLDGRTGYVEPIVVQPVCVTCHGEAVTDEVAAQIGALYPADRSTGYKIGDLRGVFWAELPAKE